MAVPTMNPDLQTLVELQQLDTTMAALEAEVQSLPQKIAEVESQLSEHTQAVEKYKKDLAENQRARRKREIEIAAQRDKISRYKDQMLEVKTNEQYRALLHEIEYHEAEIRNIEDAMLVEMIDSEGLEKKLREAEQSLAEERGRAEKEVAAARRQKEQDETDLKGVRDRRAEVQGRLAAEIYQVYERVARYRKGLAVAEVHDGTCTACNVRLRPQAYAQARTNSEVLVCESCGRILYFVPEPEPAAE